MDKMTCQFQATNIIYSISEITKWEVFNDSSWDRLTINKTEQPMP